MGETRSITIVRRKSSIFFLLSLVFGVIFLYILQNYSSITNNILFVNPMNTLRSRLDIFEYDWPHVNLMNESVRSIVQIPPQITIVKACSICNNPFWIALPTHLVLKYYYFAGGNAMQIELATGMWDTAETRLANAVLSYGCQSGKSSALMVDVGMNHGYFSAMALAAGCRVVAFEPTKYHFHYTNITVALSDHEYRFKLYPFAASDITGQQIPFDDWSVTAAKKRQEDGQSVRTVTSARVDDFVQEDVLYLKIDVEGHEATVLKGLANLLKTKVVLVILWEQGDVIHENSTLHTSGYLQTFGYFISEYHHGGIGNFIALHPRLDSTLRQTIMAMKDINIKEALSASGTDWWKY